MNQNLTNRQLETLRAIYNSLRDSGYPPSLADLREKLDVSSNQAVLDLLDSVEKKGFIKREEGAVRGIKILEKGFKVLGVAPISPHVGASQAGPYTAAFEDIQWKSAGHVDEIDDMLIKVNGDSMIGAGIEDGDVVVVRKSTEFKNGDIVLARNDDDTTIKRLVNENGRTYLKPENPKHKNIPIYPDTRLLGRVVRIIGKS